MERVFLPVLPFSPVTTIPPLPHTQLHPTTTFYQKEKREKPGNPKKNILSDVQWQWTENNSHAYTVGFNSQHQDDYEY
jgi:hypothetical protein